MRTFVRSPRIAAVLLAVATCAPALAARVPDWARPIVDAAAEPTTSPSARRIVLFREHAVTVHPDGTLHTEARTVLQMTEAVNDIAVDWFPFRDGDRIRSRAWHVPPGEKAQRERSQADIAIGDGFLSDARARLVHVPDLRRGSLVVLEFTSDETPYDLAFSEWFHDAAPVSLWRISVELPAGWTARHAWLRGDGPAPTTAGAVTTWEKRDLPAPPKATLADDHADVVPLLVVGFQPPPGAAPVAPAFANWGAMATWAAREYAKAAEPDAAVRAAADRECAGAGRYACATALARFVRDKVRYVAIELGKGSYVPHTAATTLGQLYGDCKDKATLLAALLETRDIGSWPLLLHASSPDTVADAVPALAAFNHVILAVALADGDAAPAGATLDVPGIGRVLVIDPTASDAAIGTFPADEAGHRALLVDREKGALVTLPPGGPAANRIVRTLAGAFGNDGSLALEQVTVSSGDPARRARAAFDASERDDAARSEAALRETWFDIEPGPRTVERERADGTFAEKVAWRVRRAPTSGADLAVPLFTGLGEALPRTGLANRTVPVAYAYPRTIRYEVSWTGIPEYARVPAPRAFSNGAGSVTTTIAREGTTVRATCELVLARARFETAAFPELKALWSALASAASAEIIVPK